MSSEGGVIFSPFICTQECQNANIFLFFCAAKPFKITHPYRNPSFPVDSYRTAQQDYYEADVSQRFFFPSHSFPRLPVENWHLCCAPLANLLIRSPRRFGKLKLPLLWHVRLFLFHRPQFQPRLSGKCLGKPHCCWFLFSPIRVNAVSVLIQYIKPAFSR